jgi:hypothetical protein
MARKRGSILFPVIYKIINNLDETHKGPFEDTYVRLQLSEFLRTHPEYREETIKQAARVYHQYQKIVRPRPSSPGGFYHPKRIIPAAPAQSCTMQRVTLAQFDFWENHDTAAFIRASEAHEEKQAYWADRKRGFASTGLLTLGDVERAVFGYVEPPVPTMPPEILDPDPDEDEE